MGKVFLVIDDDMVSQFTARYAVQQSNFDAQIYVCDSATEALNLLTELKDENKPIPDYILLDLIMPEMTGWEFIDELQSYNGSLNQMKIFIMSAFTNAKDRERAKNHRAIDGYYEKPISRNMIQAITK
ncbi:response regulator [Maribacter stanieri]|uniref:response regulator n=1 Tax=Maribacter stanieri TaxID=440514 RepID=UPI0030D8A98C|tara:strand:+ start:911 stop:1294 length:384 start_codon:yes stop_codon:yes gene_type:complete